MPTVNLHECREPDTAGPLRIRKCTSALSRRRSPRWLTSVGVLPGVGLPISAHFCYALLVAKASGYASPEEREGNEPWTREEGQRDIAFGNTYRLEYIKHLVSISTGIFVFTVAFMKDLVGKPISSVVDKPLLIAGWATLVTSIIAGIFHMRCWGAYYIAWGLYWNQPKGQRQRAVLTMWRRVAEWTQMLSFLAGLVLLVVFASINLLG